MSISKALLCRVGIICTLVVLGISLIGGTMLFLLITGKFSVNIDASLIKYFVIYRTIWKVPIGFYVAIIALISLSAHRSVSWSVFWNTVLFAGTLGMLRDNPSNILLWIMIISGFIALCISSATFEGGLKVFLTELFDSMKQLRQRPASAWKIVAATLAVAFVVNYVHNEMVIRTSVEARDTHLLEWYKDAHNKVIAANETKLKIFTDYQCPACSQLVPEYLKTAIAAGNGAAMIEFHDYPLDASCNDLLESSLHPAACYAAYAVRLIDKEIPEDGHDFRSWLYAHRAELSYEVILRRLEEIGINNPGDMFNEEIKQAVYADIQAAKAYGINSVPSVVLNEVLLPAGLNPNKLELLMKYVMAASENL